MNGTGKPNVAKSDGGPREWPGFLTIKMISIGPEFEGLQTTDSSKNLLKFRSDGGEMVNQLLNGVEMRSRHRVENGALLADYRIITGQGEFTQSDRIIMSADGETLTTERLVRTAQGNINQKLVIDRQ